MATTIDLTVGLNLTIGSVPLALEANVNTGPEASVYTFNGCIQEYEIPLGRFLSFVGEQFKVSVELPPELNLSAKIDYVAGQVSYTKPKTGDPTTELGVACKFDLTVGTRNFVIEFYADVKLDSAKKAGNPYVIGASIETELAFADLPLVGSIPGFRDLMLTNIGFSYTNADPAAEKPVEFNIPKVAKSKNPLYTRATESKDSFDYKITGEGPQRTLALNSKGFALTAGLVNNATKETANSFALPLALPPAPQPVVPEPSKFAAGKTSTPSSPVHWINIDKTFGPVNLRQIGLNYSQGEATFGLSAGFTLAAFSLELEGLTITFPLPLSGPPSNKAVRFDLQGLAINIQTSTFAIGGAFLKSVDGDITSYYGLVMVRFGTFGFKAMGGYTPAQAGKKASFFLYVNIEAPLGGPPFLFVRGLAGGFGINRSLILPTIDDLPTYLLLPGKAPAAKGTPAETIKTVLPQLKTIFTELEGQYWVAAGIKFTSFEMIEAFVLVTVAFGVDLQIGVIGTCAMTLPKGSPYPVAYIEIVILASFTASTGLLAVEGKLAPSSYVYGGFVKLTGGFAFYIWVSGEFKGDFVVSVGGYHPAFNRPKHYPVVPRLGIAFGLGPFQVTGQAYFALTPAMMMAGISMSAVWNSGPIKAWLNAGIDFLIAWAPFHYEAGAYITIGCSVNLGLFTLNVQIGASLSVWGPPFGGEAVVDLSVITFTIAFGAKQLPPAPVGWKTFKNDFLPKDSPKQLSAMPPLFPGSRRRVKPQAAPELEETNIIKASVQSGLDPRTAPGFDWLLTPNNFAILTNTTIPANKALWKLSNGDFEFPNRKADYHLVEPPATALEDNAPYLELDINARTYSNEEVWNPTLDIGPMELAEVTSTFTITLMRGNLRNHPTAFEDVVTDVAVLPQLLDSTKSLWAKTSDSTALNTEAVLRSTLVGFLITPIPRAPGSVSDVPLGELLFTQGNDTGFAFQKQSVNPDFTVHSSTLSNELRITVSGSHTIDLPNFDFMLSSLVVEWVTSQRKGILNDLNSNGFSTYGPDQLDLKGFATETALVDWPMVNLLGAIL